MPPLEIPKGNSDLPFGSSPQFIHQFRWRLIVISQQFEGIPTPSVFNPYTASRIDGTMNFTQVTVSDKIPTSISDIKIQNCIDTRYLGAETTDDTVHS